ncbi:hypothetical protein [Paracoccus benzoatiresistens]|uniref:Uncharacterized protein n=1 Tax=Paracoccus benzoatiresistens TaxID=2997341 RepID=A0ABT4JAZ4_9RHOB|nr:hypothetical protein [Paracoccus sp. EF6]MCZ0964308.1 hypothetical protein [Paracoccus sp. EF6]
MLSYTALAVTQAEAAAYTGAAGVAVALQETDLMRGQRYLAARFNSRWRDPFAADAVPEEVKLAIIEAAIVEARTPGILSPKSTPATDKVLTGAKGLTWERIGDASAPDAYVPRIAAVEGLLALLTRPEVTSLFLRAIG